MGTDSDSLADPSRSLDEQGLDEREEILAALRSSRGIVDGPRGAAVRLGLKRTTLNSRMKRLGLSPKLYRRIH
jgi:formate hydrogenlyase transcriptional activator